MKSSDTRRILMVSQYLLWRRRFPGLVALVAGVIGLGVLFYVEITQSGRLNPAVQVFLAFMYIVCVVAGLLLTLSINATGILAEGIAPPFKLPMGLLREPFVLPWTSLKSVSLELLDESKATPDGYQFVLELKSGQEIRFTSRLVGGRFLSEAKARRFRALLTLAAQRGLANPFPSGAADPAVQAVLSENIPESDTYRRSRASFVGTLVGAALIIGVVTLGFFKAYISNDISNVVFVLAMILFFISLTNRRLLSRSSRKGRSG